MSEASDDTDARMPTTRFSGRGEAYRRGRPSYPEAAVDVVLARLGRGVRSVVDLGSGTGIFTHRLLARGLEVAAVEPNADMREIAEAELAARPGFRSIAAPAEATGLADGSIDGAVAAQAFHWFDVEATRRELQRVLRPPRPVVLLWNGRDVYVPVAAAFEAVLARHAIRLDIVGHHGPARRAKIDALFDAGCTHDVVRHREQASWDRVCAFLGSASYLPAAGAPGHDALIADARTWFDAYAHRDDAVAPGVAVVALDYVCDIYSASLDATS